MWLLTFVWCVGSDFLRKTDVTIFIVFSSSTDPLFLCILIYSPIHNYVLIYVYVYIHITSVSLSFYVASKLLDSACLCFPVLGLEPFVGRLPFSFRVWASCFHRKDSCHGILFIIPMMFRLHLQLKLA